LARAGKGLPVGVTVTQVVSAHGYNFPLAMVLIRVFHY